MTHERVLDVLTDARPVMVPFSKARDNSVVIQGGFQGLFLERKDDRRQLILSPLNFKTYNDMKGTKTSRKTKTRISPKTFKDRLLSQAKSTENVIYTQFLFKTTTTTKLFQN